MANITKLITVSLMLITPSLSYGGGVDQFNSKNYVALIVDHCERGDLSCKKIEYFGVNKNTGAAIQLKGVSILCGNNWCGYQFKSGNVRYYIYDHGNEAELRIEQGSKELLSERGELIHLGGFE